MTDCGDALLREKWDVATPYGEFVEDVEQYESLWRGLYKRPQLPEWAVEQAKGRCQEVHFLATLPIGAGTRPFPSPSSRASAMKRAASTSD